MASGAANQLNQLSNHHSPNSNSKDSLAGHPHFSYIQTPSVLQNQASHLSQGIQNVDKNAFSSDEVPTDTGAASAQPQASQNTLEWPHQPQLFGSTSSTQPISIPSPSTFQPATIFQRVTPFGTPSNFSLPSYHESSGIFSLSSSLSTSSNNCLKSQHLTDVPTFATNADPTFSKPVFASTVGSSTNSTHPSSKPRGQRCGKEGCFDKVAKIIGSCKYCEANFCSLHRLPEQHACSHLEDVKKASFDKYSDKLLKEKCVAEKV